jgi:hypothetical protein
VKSRLAASARPPYVQGPSEWPGNCVRSDGTDAEDSSHQRPNGCASSGLERRRAPAAAMLVRRRTPNHRGGPVRVRGEQIESGAPVGDHTDAVVRSVAKIRTRNSAVSAERVAHRGRRIVPEGVKTMLAGCRARVARGTARPPRGMSLGRLISFGRMRGTVWSAQLFVVSRPSTTNGERPVLERQPFHAGRTRRSLHSRIPPWIDAVYMSMCHMVGSLGDNSWRETASGKNEQGPTPILDGSRIRILHARGGSAHLSYIGSNHHRWQQVALLG